jgi:hypothetical protein
LAPRELESGRLGFCRLGKWLRLGSDWLLVIRVRKLPIGELVLVQSVPTTLLSPLVVVISFDELSQAAIGCYGNDWVETPNFDRLATIGTVFQRPYPPFVTASGKSEVALGPSFDSGATDWSWLSPQQSFCLAEEQTRRVPSFPVLGRLSGETGQYSRPNKIPFANLVSATLLTLNAHDHPSLLWLASAGVPDPWLPPNEIASLYFDEFEERGWQIPLDYEQSWGKLWPTYGAYVSMLDHHLGRLVTRLEQLSQKRPVYLWVCGAQGSKIDSLVAASAPTYGLPESVIRGVLLAVGWHHGATIGPAGHGERIAQLLAIQQLGQLVRVSLGEDNQPTGSVLTPRQIMASVPAATPERIVVRGGEKSFAIVTAQAALTCTAAESASDETEADLKASLFRMPDDYWNMQNLADLEPVFAEEMLAAAGVATEA